MEKIREVLMWHKPFNKDLLNYYENNGDRKHYCPNCGVSNIKNNGNGFFRCKSCNKKFIILVSKEKDVV